MTATEIVERVLELAASDAGGSGVTLAREVGDRAALEAARFELQERIRRNGDPRALKGLRVVSAALAELPRAREFDFFNNGKKNQPS